jgi:hypothetical protein
MIEAKLEGGFFTVKIPANARPEPSATGKTLVVATSHGNQPSTAKIGDNTVIVGINAYIKPRV